MTFGEIPFTVTYLTGGPIDISRRVNSVKAIYAGSGRIRTATLMLDAQHGRFITNTYSGTSPIIDKFDKIKIQFVDKNNLTKTATFEVDQILKQLDESGGYLLPLELKGRERALQDIKTQAYYEFKTPYFVINDLIKRYNKAKGYNQPTIQTTGDFSQELNFAPNNVNNVYDFSQGVTYFDAIMQVISRLNQDTDLGGYGTFFSMTFDDSLFSASTVFLNIFEQGKTVGTIPTLANSNTDPFHSITNQTNTPSGTQVLVRGTPNTSTLKADTHRYASIVEMIQNYPNYDPTTTYISGIRINVGNQLYEAIANVPLATPPPNISYWFPITVTDVFNGIISAKFPFYDAGLTYEAGQFVKNGGIGYKAKTHVPVSQPPPNGTYWDVVTIQYSPFTNNKVTVTKNGCSHPQNGFVASGFDSPAFPDGNLVVRDRVDPVTGEYKFYRDFVICRAKNDNDIKNDSNLKKYLMGSNNDKFYQGFAVLVDTSLGAVGGAFVGNDRFGRAFANSYVVWTGYEWIVTRVPQKGDQCAVRYEGKNYEWNYTPSAGNRDYGFGNAHRYTGYTYKLRDITGTLAWRDISATVGGNDCFHHPYNIESVDGLILKTDQGLDYSSYVTGSALKITFQFDLSSITAKTIKTVANWLYQGAVKFAQKIGINNLTDNFPTLTSEQSASLQIIDWYDYGWWYWIDFPYPFSTFNGISEKVGSIFGGGDNVDSDPTLAAEFALMDLQNANYSPSGLTGFNHNEVENMGSPTTGIEFLFQFDAFFSVDGINYLPQAFDGDITFTITVYDILKQVWRADFKVRFFHEPQLIPIPWSAFTVSRPSRTPIQLDSLGNTILDALAVSEIEIRSIFEERKVLGISIQLAATYDENLRFAPTSLNRLLNLTWNLGKVRLVGIIDKLAFTKTPFATSGPVYDRVINPEIIDASNVRNLIQLESIAQAEAQLANLPFEQYVVKRDGDCSLTLEQSVYLQDANLINEEDKPSTPNTRKLIVMTDELSFTEQEGFISTHTLTKRLGGP